MTRVHFPVGRGTLRGLMAMAFLAMAVAGPAACGGDDDTPAGPPPTATKAGAVPSNLTTVHVRDNRFTPLGLQVPAGTRVTWQFEGTTGHSVTGVYNGESVDSGVLTGGNFEFVFDEGGTTFEYTCSVHGAAMAGTVTVH